MTEEPTIRERVAACHADNPTWTAREIASSLGVKLHHVYNNAYALKIALPAAPRHAFTAAPTATVQLPAVVHGRAPDGVPVADFTVFADTPAGMIEAQASMIQWCDDKVAAANLEKEDAHRNAYEGANSGFKTDAWDKRARDVGKRIDFYEKVKAALQAGYYIVPPFPIDIFAIRTAAQNPRGDWKREEWSSAHQQKEQMLPAGEGRYVNPTPMLEGQIIEEPKHNSTELHKVKYWKPSDFMDVIDFPFKLARAEVMNATAAAMGLKIFDRMGVLPERRSPDPIVCGQILMPHRGKSPLTFFVAWWINTRDL